jgi:hypothetical protein
MAHRSTHPLDTVKSSCTLVTASLVGAGGTDDLVPETNGDIVSAVYSATGVYDIVFRHSYPELKSVLSCPVVGTTDGLFAMFSAIDVEAKTATIEFYVGSTKTVLATTDTCYVNLLVRNSGANG